MNSKTAIYPFLLLSLLCMASCASPVTTSEQAVTRAGNNLKITSGTLNKGRFIAVANAQKTWVGPLKGGKEKWATRRNFLNSTARMEIERICGTWFVAIHKGPIYTMLDNDETMGGAAPMLGVSVAMLAYLAAEAATQEINVPTSAYLEFSCKDDEK